MRVFYQLMKLIRNRKGWFIVGLFIVCGILLYSSGKYIEFGTPNREGNLWSSILAGLGTLVLVSGVSGAVMKILAVEGFFLDAVAEAAHGREGLSRLGNGALSEVWVNCNRILHLSNMEPDSDAPQRRSVHEMRDELERALREKMPSQEKHFVNRNDRVLTISWADETRQTVLIEDVINSDLIKFREKEPLVWTASVTSEMNNTIDDDTISEKETRLTNGGKEDLVVENHPSADGSSIISTFTSTPKEIHKIYRKREWRLKIMQDPNFFTITRFIVRNADIRIINNAESLGVFIMYFGKKDLFHQISGERLVKFRDSAHIRLAEVMLPNEGYGLTLIKLDT